MNILVKFCLLIQYRKKLMEWLIYINSLQIVCVRSSVVDFLGDVFFWNRIFVIIKIIIGVEDIQKVIDIVSNIIFNLMLCYLVFFEVVDVLWFG